MKTIAIILRVEKFDTTYKWFLNESYISALQRYNVVLFPLCTYSSILSASQQCDGLIIPGGYDIHSYYMQETYHPNTTCYDKEMDCFDMACIEAFIKAQKPILGICRGMQIINVFFKGTLQQDINMENHAPQHLHTIQFDDSSFLNNIYPSSIMVNSYHHQIVSTLGRDLRISAQTSTHYIEAMEHLYLPIIAVQWHPELMERDQILPYFLSMCTT